MMLMLMRFVAWAVVDDRYPVMDEKTQFKLDVYVFSHPTGYDYMYTIFIQEPF